MTPVEETNESADSKSEVVEPEAPVVEETPLPAEPVEVAPDAEQQAEPVDAGVDEVDPVDPQDETDVRFALDRETADGSGFDSDKDAEMLESDFESFAEDDVESDDEDEA